MRLSATLWGPDRDLDYWSALRAGLVDQGEQRAMALLASISDEQRFGLYALIGKYRAMGNVTRRIYVIERHGGVIERYGGKSWRWCIYAENRFIAPETDNVVTLKTLIEGEEMYFRRVGIRSLWPENRVTAAVNSGIEQDPEKLEREKRHVESEWGRQVRTALRAGDPRFQMWRYQQRRKRRVGSEIAFGPNVAREFDRREPVYALM